MRFHRSFHRSFHRPSRRAVALAAASLLVLAACGGDDEPVAAPVEDDEASPIDTRPPVDGPVSTVDPEILEQLEGGVGPVDVEGSSLPAFTDEVSDAAIGLQAPVLVGLDLEGRPIRIDPAEDGPTMLVFVAHWCPHCNEEIPKLNRMRAYAQFPDELNVVAVSTAMTPERPNWPPDEWLTETLNWRYPTMLDGVDPRTQSYIASDAYGVTGFPFVTLVDGDGAVAARWSGEREPEQILGYISVLGLG